MTLAFTSDGAQATRSLAEDLSQALRTTDRVEPSWLADVLRYAGGSDPSCTAVRHSVQDFLLERTLAHARQQTAFYRSADYAGWTPSPPGQPPALDGFPVLWRDTLVENFDAMIAGDVTLRSVCHTSGTTGTPLDLYKSYEEVDFIGRYYARLFEPLARSLTQRPLVMTMPNVNHGVPVPMPGIGTTFVTGVTDDTLIRDARRLLESRFKIKGHDDRISLLSGLPHHVLLLTSYLLEQGIDPREFRMQGVTITGGYLAMNWIEFLADSWGCIVHDRFTLTEAIGGGSRIPGTDVYVLDPHIIGEVLDVDAEHDSPDAVGLLVLTNLHPFVQMQPLIRYTTGDVVRRRPGPGPLRFQFLGKLRNCVSRRRAGRREWLLFSARLNDIVSQLPDVNVHEWFSNVRSVHDRTVGSLPVLSVSSEERDDRTHIDIDIELRYAPHTRRQHVEGLRRAITEGLRATPDTVLAAGMDAGDVQLTIDFVGPGALNAPLVIKI